MTADEKAKKIVLELLQEVYNHETTPENALIVIEKLVEDDEEGFELKDGE